jgi:YwiC-like protein
MLVIPAVLGGVEGGARSAAAWLVPVATALVFLAHHAIVPWAQRARGRKPSPPGYAARRLVWGALYLAGASIVFSCAFAATIAGSRGPLLAIAGVASLLVAIYAVADVLDRGRSIAAEVLGMAGVSLSGPMMAAAAGRPFDLPLFGAAALTLGYFLSSLAFVRAYERMREERTAAVSACLVAHGALAAGLVAAAAGGLLPPWWWVAFVPVAARTAWGLAHPPENLRQLGWREIGVATSFTLLGSVALHHGETFTAHRAGTARYQAGPATASATATSTPGSPISRLPISSVTAVTMSRTGITASIASPGIPRGTRNAPRRSGSSCRSFNSAANSSASAAV